MATSDPSVAMRILDEIDDVGCKYAILHREAEIASGIIVSDVDVVVDRPVDQLVLGLVERMSEFGIGLVMRWPYDRGSLTTFWARSDCSSGAQVDFLYDSDGRGKYGLRTDLALHRSIDGRRWKRLDPSTERLYLLSKRLLKGSTSEVRQLLMISGLPEQSLLEEGILAGQPGRAVGSALRTGIPTSVRLRLNSWIGRLFGISRLRSRLVDPVGVVVSVCGAVPDDARLKVFAEELSRRLAKYLIRSRVMSKNAFARRLRCGIAVRRPHAVIVYGSRPVVADVIIGISEDDTDDLFAVVWAGLQRLAVERTQRAAGSSQGGR